MQKEPYTEVEVEKDVWLVGGYHGGGIGVNAVILTSGKHAVLIDTLTRPSEVRRLERKVRRGGVEPVALVNTHWHTDHTAGNCLFDCPIWAQKLGNRFLRLYWPKWMGSPKDKRSQGLRMKLPDHRFDQRASIDLDGQELQLIRLPGHTSDSIGVYLPERRILVAGDAVMDLPFVWFGDASAEIRSLQQVRRLRPRVILQGHGQPCSYQRVDVDIRYLQKISRAAAQAQADGIPRRDFVKRPKEDFLPPSRARELGDSWNSLHTGNLWRLWIDQRKSN